jgi:hypothetical protein
VLNLVVRARLKVANKNPVLVKVENPLSVLTFMLESRRIRPLSSYYRPKGVSSPAPLLIIKEAPVKKDPPDMPE